MKKLHNYKINVFVVVLCAVQLIGAMEGPLSIIPQGRQATNSFKSHIEMVEASQATVRNFMSFVEKTMQKHKKTIRYPLSNTRVSLQTVKNKIMVDGAERLIKNYLLFNDTTLNNFFIRGLQQLQAKDDLCEEKIIQVAEEGAIIYCRQFLEDLIHENKHIPCNARFICALQQMFDVANDETDGFILPTTTLIYLANLLVK